MNRIDKKLRRKIMVRSKIKGTKDVPRLSVFRSNKFIYAQLIDDENRKTILGASEKQMDESKGIKKAERAKALGLFVAKKALSQKIQKVVFDRGSYAYHGRVESVAENIITVSGIDKTLVGNTAARIRDIKPPEPYKGKGIRYLGEKIRRKAGKAAKAVGTK